MRPTHILLMVFAIAFAARAIDYEYASEAHTFRFTQAELQAILVAHLESKGIRLPANGDVEIDGLSKDRYGPMDEKWTPTVTITIKSDSPIGKVEIPKPPKK